MHIVGGKMDENQIGQLVELVMQGDQNAFSTLYEVTKNPVYFICISFLNNEEDAKDVMQETYVAAYNNLYQLQDRGKFLAWINQIAVNKCKRIVMQKTPTFTDIEALDNAPVEENESFLPEEYINQKEKRKIVMDIMRNYLSDIQYETVILYYFNGLTIEEVADIMECPPGTVKYRLSVARAKIRDGVMAYEKKTEDKLYSVSGIPVLAYLLTQEACEIFVPNVFPEIVNTIVTGSAIGMSVGQTVTDSGVGSSMGYAVENMAGTGVAGTEVAKTVGKVGLGVMKKKIAIGIISLAVVGAGATAIILGSKSKDDKKDTTTETNITTEDITETAINTTEEVIEETGEEELVTRWIMDVDFSAETIATPEGLSYEPYFRDIDADTNTPAGTITYPIEKEDFDQYSIFFYANDSDKADCIIYSTLDEALSDTRLSTQEESQIEYGEKVEEITYSLTSEKNQYGYISSIDTIIVTNASSEPKTYKECVDNGWFVKEFLYSDEALGLSEDVRTSIKDYNGDGDVDDEDTLWYLVEIWGPPTYFYGFDYDEDGSSVDDVVDGCWAGISSAMYFVAWEFDEYTIELYLSDVYSGNRTISIEASTYYDDEAWDAIAPENELEALINAR